MTLSSILESRYGVSLLAAPPTAILWAAEYLISQGLSPASVKAELRKANRRRESVGKIPACAPYGHRLF